jgi:hypothetical protein
MLNLFWWILPESALPLVIVAAAIGLITGLIPRKVVFGLLGAVIAMLMLGPFISVLLDALPVWLLLILMVFIALSFCRAILNATLGQSATSHMVGFLAADVVRLFFRGLFWPLRLFLR